MSQWEFRIEENPPWGWDLSLCAGEGPEAQIIFDQVHMPTWQDAETMVFLFRRHTAAATIRFVREADE